MKTKSPQQSQELNAKSLFSLVGKHICRTHSTTGNKMELRDVSCNLYSFRQGASERTLSYGQRNILKAVYRHILGRYRHGASIVVYKSGTNKRNRKGYQTKCDYVFFHNLISTNNHLTISH